MSDKSHGRTLSAAGAVVALCAASSAAVAAGPSFACALARGVTERAICATPALSAIDRAHVKVYRDTLGQARRVSGARAVARVRNAERTILARRSVCGADHTCIRAVYRDGTAQMLDFLHQLD